MFGKMGWEVVGIKDFFNADLIQFTGGSDVTPMLYGESLHPKTYCSQRRDLEEAGYFPLLNAVPSLWLASVEAVSSLTL
ncbi:hypothetical protein [Pseudomonas phage PPAT]|nr:hypothetical protein [Pseudomonas phage PPAT]